MADSAVQSLLAAVGRHLWREQLIAASRQALWGSAALMLVSAALHLLRPLSTGAALLPPALLWTWLMVRAATQRPTLPRCALWADRHLGGASAFSTLLEGRRGAPPPARAPALQALERWAATQAPHSLRLLAASNTPAALTRPLLAMLVCAALAALVMTLPDAAPAVRAPGAAASAASAPAPVTPLADAMTSTALSGEIARALRSAAAREEPEADPGSDAAGRAAATGSGKPDQRGAGVAAPAGTPLPQDRTAVRGASAALAVDAASVAGTPGAPQTSGEGSGRDAGSSADPHADGGASRRPQGTIAVQRLAAGSQRPLGQKRADVDQLATYDEGLAAADAATQKAGPAPAAATPPAAARSSPLSPTETSYVQAWMKANGQRR